jgi:hypothetical protein
MDELCKGGGFVQHLLPSGMKKAWVVLVFCFLCGHSIYLPVPEKSSPGFSSIVHPFLRILQSSSLSPSEVASRGGRAGVYNWDQTIRVWCDYRVQRKGVLRYTTDGTIPEKDSPPFPSEGIYLSEGRSVILSVALIGDSGIVDNICASERYQIDYHAYDDRLIIDYPDKQENCSHDQPAVISYRPVCGEIFSIDMSVSSSFLSEDELSAVDKKQCAGILRSRLVSSTVFSPVFRNAETPVSASAAVAKGSSSGGVLTRITGRLSIKGQRTAPLEKHTDKIIVYPALEIQRLDMHNRPAVTPYLWIASEPVVECDIVSRDFFDNSVHPEDHAVCIFRVQYAEKNYPYGSTVDRIFWLDTPPRGALPWGDPSPADKDPRYRSISGSPLTVIDTEPFGWKGCKWDAPRIIIQSVCGRAYYQIFNPWDSFRIGEKGHYREINDAAKRGRLDACAFRTVVRFRVMAVKDGFRHSRIKRSFESDRCAAFDSSTQTRRYDAGTLPGSSAISDMEKYTSYPIEIFERPQGWTQWNHAARTGDGTKWFQKFGVVWTGKGRAGSINLAGDSVNREFSRSRMSTIVFSHGFEMRQTYELLLYQARTWDMNTLYNAADCYEKESPGCRHGIARDYADWLSFTAAHGDPGYEWLADRWIDNGFNVGYFHWNTFSRESDPVSMIPWGAEGKIWNPTAAFLMRCYADGDPDTVMADCVRSANIGMIMAQCWLDAVPRGYIPGTVVFTGHSLGSQVVMNASRRLVAACSEKLITNAFVPDRIDLLDPYWSNRNDYPGQTCCQYADEIRAWSLSSGDRRTYGDALAVPIQWFRTTALTQPLLKIGNDRNLPLMTKCNYLKLCFLHKYHGYVKDGGVRIPLAGWQLEAMSADAHSECIWWYFRSIERDQDAGGIADGFSARSRTRDLSERIESMRDSSSWQWFEMRGGQSGSGGGRDTISTKDDLFDLQKAQSGQGDGHPEYN